MSRIYFHTQHEGTAEVAGTERAYMGLLVGDVSASFLPRHRDDVLRHVAPGHYLHHQPNDLHFADSVRTAMTWGEEGLLLYGGKPLQSFSLQLNTLLAIGNDPLCLLARIHATCEIHGWFDGKDRAWAADVIEQGLACGLMRRSLVTSKDIYGKEPIVVSTGWDAVVELLRKGDTEPVVMSYSICESFPNDNIAIEGGWERPEDEDGEPMWDAWYEDLTADQQWEFALRGLRAKGQNKPIGPETLREPFRHGKSLLDIFG